MATAASLSRLQGPFLLFITVTFLIYTHAPISIKQSISAAIPTPRPITSISFGSLSNESSMIALFSSILMILSKTSTPDEDSSFKMIVSVSSEISSVTSGRELSGKIFFDKDLFYRIEN